MKILQLDPLPIKPLPDDKIMKASADKKLNVAKKMISVFDRVVNTVGKGENAGYQHFFLFLTVFSKAFFKVVKNQIVW